MKGGEEERYRGSRDRRGNKDRYLYIRIIMYQECEKI
jgi:hypothetical protein